MHPIIALLAGTALAAVAVPKKRKVEEPPPTVQPAFRSSEEERLRKQNARLMRENRALKKETGKVASPPAPAKPLEPTREEEPEPKPADPGEDNNEPHESGGETS